MKLHPLPALLAMSVLATTVASSTNSMLLTPALAAANAERPAPATEAETPRLAAALAVAGIPALPAPESAARAAVPAEEAPSTPPPAPNVYSLATDLSPAVAGIPRRVYVPNSDAGTLTVIDPDTFKVVDQYAVGRIPHHVTPAWDLSKLYVDDEGSSMLTIIDPVKGKPAGTIPVSYPYNLYFTPDGQKAVVVAERLQTLEFRDRKSWAPIESVRIPWPGVDHMDFSADGSYLLASTEWSGVLAKVSTVSMELLGGVRVGSLPVDVRLSADGSVFYVANQGRGGVSLVDGEGMKEVGFIATGRGAHGLQVSRDSKSLYVSNRLAGSVSVIDFASRQVTATWNIGGSPDMLQLSPDGRQLWLSSRFDGEVYVVDTQSGKVLSRVRAGAGAHGLTYFPAPGNHSLGHNGVYR
jgi:YVTN family beta-propeller protein